MAGIKNQDMSSFLYAFALGCLDKEDFIQLQEYIESGGEFPWQELGEFQNLAALLPSFLIVEQPAADVKNRVAKRLSRIKDVKKPIQPQPIQTAGKTAKQPITPPPPMPSALDIPDEELELQKGSSPLDIEEYQPVPQFSRRVVDQNRPPQGTQIKGRSDQEVQDRNKYGGEQEDVDILKPMNIPEPDYSSDENFVIDHPAYDGENVSVGIPDSFETGTDSSLSPTLGTLNQIIEPDVKVHELEEIRKKVVEDVGRVASVEDQIQPEIKPGISPSLFYVFVFILLGVIGLVYYLLSGEIGKIKKTISAETTTSLESFKDVVRTQYDVQNILMEKDVFFVNLIGTGNYPQGFGRIIYSNGMGRGYLLLGNLPVQLKEKGYQLWVEIDGEIRAVGGTNSPALNIEYFALSQVPVPASKQRFSFFITEEPVTGASKPSSTKVLVSN